mmetsp:Transcript_7178/g.18832  ORF Transcript_7178/g.18832 Transcript_7178/m.18832 type:complete len:359 (-) Transcript_7178:539-1615(-)
MVVAGNAVRVPEREMCVSHSGVQAGTAHDYDRVYAARAGGPCPNACCACGEYASSLARAGGRGVGVGFDLDPLFRWRNALALKGRLLDVLPNVLKVDTLRVRLSLVFCHKSGALRAGDFEAFAVLFNPGIQSSLLLLPVELFSIGSLIACLLVLLKRELGLFEVDLEALNGQHPLLNLALQRLHRRCCVDRYGRDRLARLNQLIVLVNGVVNPQVALVQSLLEGRSGDGFVERQGVERRRSHRPSRGRDSGGIASGGSRGCLGGGNGGGRDSLGCRAGASGGSLGLLSGGGGGSSPLSRKAGWGGVRQRIVSRLEFGNLGQFCLLFRLSGLSGLRLGGLCLAASCSAILTSRSCIRAS